MLMQILLAVSALTARTTRAQAPNTLAVYNPDLRTASNNATTFIIPISEATAAGLASPYDLLEVPVNDTTLFPNGFPAGMHPLFVSSGVQYDIRISALEIDCLLGALSYLPFVDRLGDGTTPFAQPVDTNYIGGCNGESVMAYVPSLVGSLGGTIIEPASFLPDTAAYEALPNGQYSVVVKEMIVSNPVSGPGVEPAVYDLLFSTTKAPNYTAHTFHSILNQPIILDDGLCLRNAYYFNESFADPIFRTGMVTLYTPNQVAGVYEGVGGYSATAEILGNNPQTCEAAAASVDPVASV